MLPTRRDFLLQTFAAASAALVCNVAPLRAHAAGGWRPGLQLYTVMTDLQRDFDGTLAQVRRIGYEEVEMAGFFDKKPVEIKQALAIAGLRCRSMHIFGAGNVKSTMEYANVVGADYVVTSIFIPERIAKQKKAASNDYPAMLRALTGEDYGVIAEECNQMGRLAKEAGLQLCYHNHNIEFRPLSGGTGYDQLLRRLDPDLVKFELDCGWMAAAGLSPADYILKYPDRYRLLHIKDFKLVGGPSFSTTPGEAPAPTELGRGNVDYHAIFKAARQARIEQYYVEQEPPFKDMPALDAIKVDFAYVTRMAS